MTSARAAHWSEQAACLGSDPAMFDLPSDRRNLGRHFTDAATVCARCPVRSECYADAVQHRDEGVRGGAVHGLTDQQGKRLPPLPLAVAGSTRTLAPCGTYAAYRRHLRAHETPDFACLRAHADTRKAERHAASDRKVHVDDVEWLAQSGLSAPQIAARLGVTVSAVQQACRRAGRKDVWLNLSGRYPRPRREGVPA